MNAEQERQLREQISVLEKQRQALKAQIDLLTKKERPLGKQILTILKQLRPDAERIVRGQWECGASPTGRCVYDMASDMGDDECLFCGEPEDRQ